MSATSNARTERQQQARSSGKPLDRSTTGHQPADQNLPNAPIDVFFRWLVDKLCSGGAEMPLQYGQGLPNPQMQTQMAGGPNPAYPANPGMSSQHHSPLRPENEPHAGLGSKPGQSGLSAGRGNVMSGGMGHQYSQQPSHQLFPGNGMASQRPHPMAKGVMSSVQGMPGQPGSRYPGIHQQALVGMASLSNSRQLGGPTLRSTY